MRVLTGSRPTESVVLVTITVVRDTPPDRHFSAWSRPKPAPDPLPGPSVASGVIPTKGGRNGPVPATSGRASTGRWRSSPWKRCNHAAPRGRVREHPAPLGALRRGGAHGRSPLFSLKFYFSHGIVRKADIYIPYLPSKVNSLRQNSGMIGLKQAKKLSS